MIEKKERRVKRQKNCGCGRTDIEVAMIKPEKVGEELRDGYLVEKLVYLCPGESCQRVLARSFVRRKVG